MANPNPSPNTRFKAGGIGNPTGGRPKSFLKRIDEMCAKDGKHPYTELMRLLPDLKPREQAEVWLQILSYCQSKPKPTVDPSEFEDMSDEELLDNVMKMAEQLKKSA